LSALVHKSLIYNPSQHLNFDTLLSLNVHNPKMLEYLLNCYNSFVENPDHGYDYVENGIIPYTIPHFKVSDDKINRLHYWKQAGIWCTDQITPIFANTWKTAFEPTNNCYNVKNVIEYATKQTIYCLNLYPGHHAVYDTYGGYCFLNNPAICARTLLQNKPENKIAILDIDYHAGDGTANIFKDDPNVTTVSIHANTDYDYPFYGCDDETDNKTRNKFITFLPKCTPADYLQHLILGISFIREDEPNVLIIAFGGDTYKDDPDASETCRCSLDFSDYYNIGKIIRESFPNIPIVVTQEGGYNTDNIAEIAVSFLQGLCT